MLLLAKRIFTKICYSSFFLMLLKKVLLFIFHTFYLNPHVLEFCWNVISTLFSELSSWTILLLIPVQLFLLEEKKLSMKVSFQIFWNQKWFFIFLEQEVETGSFTGLFDNVIVLMLISIGYSCWIQKEINPFQERLFQDYGSLLDVYLLSKIFLRILCWIISNFWYDLFKYL